MFVECTQFVPHPKLDPFSTTAQGSIGFAQVIWNAFNICLNTYGLGYY